MSRVRPQQRLGDNGAMTEDRCVTRRGVLTGALLSTVGLLTGCSSVADVVTAPNTALSGSFTSEARLGATVRWKVITPSSTDVHGLPVVVFLHGKNGDHTMVDYWADALADHVADGGDPLAIAAMDAGNTYYHRRASGEDAGAMITEEFLPALADRGLDVSRVALAGISMGGYGALRLAAQLGPDRVPGVAVASPALWREPASFAPGAFDSARDHADNNVFGQQDHLAATQLRIDCGLSDPFLGATRDYVNEFGGNPPQHSFSAGGHNVDYWRTLVPDQLTLLATALS